MVAPIQELPSARGGLIAYRTITTPAGAPFLRLCRTEFNFAIDWFGAVAEIGCDQQNAVGTIQPDCGENRLAFAACSGESTSFLRGTGLLSNERWADDSAERLAEIAS